MGRRKVTITSEVAEEIAKISFFIESKGLKGTAIKFTKSIMNFIRNIDFNKLEYAFCRDPERALLELKCIL